MRFFTTILLILSTAGLSYWLVTDLRGKSNQPSLDDSGAVIPGRMLFDNPALLDSQSITISKKDSPDHSFSLNQNNIWEYSAPYKDRASFGHIGRLLAFSTDAEVVESIPLSEVNLSDYGFDNNWYKISIKDIYGNDAATYKIGMESSWKHKTLGTNEAGEEIPVFLSTVYVIKEKPFEDDRLYLVTDPTGDIRSYFADNFEGFRDHLPFALNLQLIEEVSIKQSNREIVIDHSTAASPWRISKPLDLDMDPSALSKLLVNLSNLRAIKLHSKGSITLPREAENLKQVSIKNFNTEEKIVLTIYPPADEEAVSAYATVSDRDVIFELPTRPFEGYSSSIASLPNSVNELRARNMLNLNRANIRGFIIRQATKPPIIIARPAPGSSYELLTVDGKRLAPNEVAIANLIAVISKEPVKDFVTDAATDLSIYNFENPTLSIDIRPLVGAPKRLIFARVGDIIYAHLLGSTVVWEVDQEAYIRIARNESEWKSNNVWNLVKNDIIQFTIHQRGQQKVTVNYDYIADTASAFVGNLDVTDKLNPIQAKFFINSNSQLNARRRLGPNNEQAIEALRNPLCEVTITSQLFDEFGLPSETFTHTLQIAKPSEKGTIIPFYYAKSSNDSDYFTISPATYFFLTINVFAEE